MAEKRSGVRVVKYSPPAEFNGLKEVVHLGNTDINFAAVQIVGEGGENNLHSHSALDGLWFVLAGRARFYGAKNAFIAEIGRYEGVLIPRGTPYWFESAGDEPLQILQVEAKAQTIEEVRTDYRPLKASAAPFIGASGTIEGPR